MFALEPVLPEAPEVLGSDELMPSCASSTTEIQLVLDLGQGKMKLAEEH